MKTIYNIITMMALFSLLASSCSKPTGSKPEGSAQVSLNISGGTKATDLNLLPNEGLKTLRVIISKGSKDIIVNDKFNITPNGDGSAVTGTNITFYDLPKQKLNFYLIANEESLGMTYTTETILAALGQGDTKIKFVDLGNDYFPKRKRFTEQYGLPMSGVGTIDLTNADPGTIQNLEITLKRAVVKMNIIVENATADAITLTRIALGEFCANSFYLFQQSEPDVPEDTDYSIFDFSNGYDPIQNATINAGENQTYTAYIYPTYTFREGVLDNPYTISLETEKATYNELVFGLKPDGNDIINFSRNTQVNIRARITTEANIDMEFDVAGWGDPIVIDVPPFNTPKK